MAFFLTEGADILGALGTYVFQGLALEAASDSRSGWEFWRVRDNDGVVVGSRLHNHLQSSGEHNMSRAHSRSTSSVHSSPTLLSRCRVPWVSFSGREGGSGSGLVRKGVGLLGQLGRRVDDGVCRGKGIGRQGGSGGMRGIWVSSGIGWGIAVLQVSLHCSLHWVIGTIICSPLLL